jgi:type IV secretory pathway VirB2 component (pilin)
MARDTTMTTGMVTAMGTIEAKPRAQSGSMRWIRLLGQVFRFLSGKIIQLVVVVAVEM